ncbi:hypothetical protein HY968_01255 [Candidatus Kaiserbacteria bacterium]|nr:hypothetical protein [Candidatus Kaiserbacteria bacterium]
MSEGMERQKDDFDRQFDNPQKMRMGPVEIALRTIRPPKLQDRLENKPPVVIAGGFGHSWKVYAHIAKEFYRGGRTTMLYNIPPHQGANFVLPNEEGAALKEFIEPNPEEAWDAVMLLEVMRKQEVKQIDVLAHSRGFIYVAIAAILDDKRAEIEARKNGPPKRKNLIRKILAYGPAGLTEHETKTRLVRGARRQDGTPAEWAEVPEEIQKEVSTPEMLAKRKAAEAKGFFEYGPFDAERAAIDKHTKAVRGKEGFKEAMENPLRVYEQIEGVAAANMLPVLKKLHDIGVKVTIVLPDQDTVYPKDRIIPDPDKATPQEKARWEEIKRYAAITTLPGQHSAVADDPQVARIALSQLSQP